MRPALVVLLMCAACSPSRLELEVPSLDTTDLLAADVISIRSAGDVVLRGGVKTQRLEVRARSLAVEGRFEVGTAHIEADDDAITFSAPTLVQGTVSDVDDIVLTGGAQLTLTGDTVFRADANADGSGRLVMQPGSSLSGAFGLRVGHAALIQIDWLPCTRSTCKNSAPILAPKSARTP